MSDFLKLLESNENSPKASLNSNRSITGLCIVTATGGIAAAISLVSLPFLTPAFRKICVPFVPATSLQIANVLKSLRGRTGRVVDLGSGDGRIVTALAAFGFQSVGVELNIVLVLYSRMLAFWKGYASNAKFYRSDFWSFNLKPYSNVVVFGTSEMMAKLEEKVKNELENESVVIACRFPLPNIKPEEIIGEGVDTVWKYRITSSTRSGDL